MFLKTISRKNFNYKTINYMDKIVCALCKKEMCSLGRHLQKHGIVLKQYKEMFPGVPTSSQSTKELRKATSLKNFGVENPRQSTKIINKAKATCLSKYGVENPSQNEEISVRATLERERTFMRKYGVKHNMLVPEIAKKRAASVVGRSQSEESNQKRRDSVRRTFQKRYGVSGPGGLTDKVREGMRRKYGAENPSQVPDLRRKAFKRAVKNGTLKPNKPERLIMDLGIPSLMYNAAGGSLIVQDAETQKCRIPDFVVLGQQKVVEHFGSFYHGQRRTGKPCEVHKSEVIEFYRKNGYSCLVVWDCTSRNIEDVKARIESFVIDK